MRKHAMFSAVLLWCVTLTAQTPKPSDSVTEVNVSEPKPGMLQQWEQGRKRHSDFHNTQKDTWTVHVYEIVTGEHVGSFVSVQSGHSWKDYDGRAAFDKLDAPDVEKNMGPYQTAGPRSFYLYRPDLSRAKEGGTPAKMLTVTHYWLIPEHVREFQEAVKAVNSAIEKASYPAKPGRWYQLANGGDVPHYALVVDRASWADMEAPPTTIDEALGQEGAQALATLRRSTKRILTELLEYRPDLSYVPQSAAAK
jgi:hypothetical protein